MCVFNFLLLVCVLRSDLSVELKRKFFVTMVESILLYGCEAWTLTTAMENALDGTYTRMLRKATNVHWSAKVTNVSLYGKLPRLSDKISDGRL